MARRASVAAWSGSAGCASACRFKPKKRPRLGGRVFALQRPVGLVGPSVDPLGEGLIKLLPDGFNWLFAPAEIPPALVLPGAAVPCTVPPLLKPVVVLFVVDPLVA